MKYITTQWIIYWEIFKVINIGMNHLKDEKKSFESKAKVNMKSKNEEFNI